MQVPADAAQAFPEPIVPAILVAIVVAMFGAFVADIALDRSIEHWKRDHGSTALGFVANLLVGVAAAIVVIFVSPPGESWLALVSTALLAGLGSEAIVNGTIRAPQKLAEAGAETKAAQAEAQVAKVELMAAGNEARLLHEKAALVAKLADAHLVQIQERVNSGAPAGTVPGPGRQHLGVQQIDTGSLESHVKAARSELAGLF